MLDTFPAKNEGCTWHICIGGKVRSWRPRQNSMAEPQQYNMLHTLLGGYTRTNKYIPRLRAYHLLTIQYIHSNNHLSAGNRHTIAMDLHIIFLNSVPSPGREAPCMREWRAVYDNVRTVWANVRLVMGDMIGCQYISYVSHAYEAKMICYNKG